MTVNISHSTNPLLSASKALRLVLCKDEDFGL